MGLQLASHITPDSSIAGVTKLPDMAGPVYSLPALTTAASPTTPSVPPRSSAA